MRLLRWLRAQHQERLRQIDERCLWPSCRDQAPDLETARCAFTLYALGDQAWLALGGERTLERIEALT